MVLSGRPVSAIDTFEESVKSESEGFPYNALRSIASFCIFSMAVNLLGGAGGEGIVFL